MNISSAQLRKAAKLQDKIEALQNQINSLLGTFGGATKRRGHKPAKVKTTRKGKKRRKMSAAGRAAIRAAQKARWAKVKAGK